MKRAFLILSCAAAIQAASEATPFHNLDFESVIPPLIPPYDFDPRVPVANALPGWTAWAGTNAVTLALTNNMFMDAAGISLYGPGGGSVIEGTYTAFLQSGYPFHQDPIAHVSAALSQTGQIPAAARSILLKARVVGGTLSASLGEETLSLTPLSAGPNYTLYGANIPDMAGQTEELRISAVSRIYSPPFPPMASWVWLDSISFSPEVIVPEPSVVALVVCGGLLFGWKILRKRPKL
jgi:hypothetical protein